MAKTIDEFFPIEAKRASVKASIFSVAQLKRLTPDELRARLKHVESNYRAVLEGLGEYSLRRELKSKE